MVKSFLKLCFSKTKNVSLYSGWEYETIIYDFWDHKLVSFFINLSSIKIGFSIKEETIAIPPPPNSQTSLFLTYASPKHVMQHDMRDVMYLAKIDCITASYESFFYKQTFTSYLQLILNLLYNFLMHIFF
jgi:hypothetical protein